jgi:hypothetical protein
VLNRYIKGVASVAVLAAGVAAAMAQDAAKQPQWQGGQAEFALYTAAKDATAPAARLTALNAWKEKYPTSDFNLLRLQTYLVTYQALGKAAEMVNTSKEILAISPKDLQALMWVTYFTQSIPNPPTPESLAAGEAAAKALPDADAPAGVAPDIWAKVKADLVAVSHNTLAFIALQRKQLDVAEQEYTKALAAVTNPPCQSQLPVCVAPAQISYSLGSTIIAEKKPERYPEAIYHLARAASLTGPAALPAATLKPADAYFVKFYTAFHGPDEAGMKDLRTQAVAAPMPPAGFALKSKAELDADSQAKFAKENPELAMWKVIKDQLTAANGQQYFESELKGTSPPKLVGKLVSTKPAVNPKELVIAISTPDQGEVTLKLETPLRGKADPGTEIKFQGVPSAFAKEPFMLTIDVDSKDKIEGWPAQAAPVVRKKAAPKKQ